MYEVFERLLKAKGLTASAISKATGVSTSTFTDWKKGRYTPKADKMQKIADFLGVSVEYLTTGNQPQAVNLSESDMELLNMLSYLNAEGRERVIEYASDLVMSGRYIKNSKFKVV